MLCFRRFNTHTLSICRYIHWVAESLSNGSPRRAEVRQFNALFKSEDPSSNPEGFLADVNPDAEEIYPHAVVETGLDNIWKSGPWPREKEGGGESGSGSDGNPPPYSIRFQGMRVAYFAVDNDSTPEKAVLNRIVTLKDTAGKT